MNPSNSRRGKYFFSVFVIASVLLNVSFFFFCVAFPLSAAVLSLGHCWLVDLLSVCEPVSLPMLSSPSLFQTLSNKSIFQNLLKEVYFSHSLCSTLLCLLSPLPGLIFPPASDNRFVPCSSPRSFHVLRCTILCKFELDLENVKIVTSLWGILQLFYPQFVALSLSLNFRLLLCFVFCLATTCDILIFYNLCTLFIFNDLKLL